MIRWTNETLNKACEIIKRHRDAASAANAVSLALGFSVTAESLDHALRRGRSRSLASLLATIAPPAAEDDVAALVKLTKGGELTIEQACDKLDVSPARLRDIVARAAKAGFAVQLAGWNVGRKPLEDLTAERRVVLPPGEQQCAAVASDIHVGSKYFLRDQFCDFVTRCYDAGARVCLVPGDILDGCYRHSRWEESHHGFQEQADEAAKVFPRLPGLVYEGIPGNHDQTFETESGMDVGRALVDVFRAHGRDDLRLHRARGAYLRLRSPGVKRGLLVELWHPLGGGSYALSYKMQKHVEAYAPGQKPDVLLTGHWHQSCYFTTRGVHALSCGTWHGGKSPFGKALGGAPAIGGWLLRWSQTKDGTVREFSPTWHGYFEQEDVRSVGLG